MKPTRQFTADEGQYSTGLSGPDAIEKDLDNINKMFDPLSVHDNSSPGGIGTENIQDASIETKHFKTNVVNDEVLGTRTVNQDTVEHFANAGKLTSVLSFIVKMIKTITGEVSWFNAPADTIKGIDQRIKNHREAVVLDHPDSSVTTAKIKDLNVTTPKINDSSVTTAKINDSAVTTPKINDSAVTDIKIGDRTLTETFNGNSTINYASGPITKLLSSLASFIGISIGGFGSLGSRVNSILMGNILNLAQLTDKFNQTTGHKHTGASGDAPKINTSGIEDNAVTTSKILDSSIVTSKIADNNVTDSKIGSRNVTINNVLRGNTLIGWLQNTWSKLALITGESSNMFDTAPPINLTVVNDKFKSTGHKHTGVNGDGSKLGTAGLEDSAVTYAKISSDAKIIIEDKYSKTQVDNYLTDLKNEIIHEIDRKEPVETFDDLYSTYPNAEDGWVCIAKDTRTTYLFNSATSEWEPKSLAIPYADDVQHGLLKSDDFVHVTKLKNLELDEQFSATGVAYLFFSDIRSKLNGIVASLGLAIGTDKATLRERANEFLLGRILSLQQLTDKFSGLLGHKHSGASGDGPKIPTSSIEVTSSEQFISSTEKNKLNTVFQDFYSTAVIEHFDTLNRDFTVKPFKDGAGSAAAITHGFNKYPIPKPRTQNTFGMAGFGEYTFGGNTEYLLECRTEYVDSNQVRIYLGEDYTGQDIKVQFA